MIPRQCNTFESDSEAAEHSSLSRSGASRILPSPQELQREYPLHAEEAALIASQRQTVKNCLRGNDPRTVIILGPCSLHNTESALAYARHVATLQQEVNDRFLLVMRAYVEKPRTALGWKGMLYDPFLDGSDDLFAGLHRSRKTLLALVRLGVPLATEFLEPLAAPYLEDLITLGFIGSRTTTSQIHRQLASHLPFPIGFKNSPDGALSSAIQAIHTANHPHSFFHSDCQGRLIAQKSLGNPDCTLVLRGTDHAPNCDPRAIQHALKALEDAALPPSLIIDCSHGNSQKDPKKQLKTFFQLMETIAQGENRIRALMLESHLREGNQQAAPGAHPDQSITDACLSWEETRSIILQSLYTQTP